MKKILTVSLVAMMAVSAARADIASTAYVDGAVGAEESSREAAINAVNTKIGNVATGKTVVTMISEAQTAAEAKVTALENGQVKTNKEAIESINAELGSMASDATVQGIQTALTTLQGTVTSNKTAADKTQTDLDTAEGKIATLEATVAQRAQILRPPHMLMVRSVQKRVRVKRLLTRLIQKLVMLRRVKLL